MELPSRSKWFISESEDEVVHEESSSGESVDEDELEKEEEVAKEYNESVERDNELEEEEVVDEEENIHFSRKTLRKGNNYSNIAKFELDNCVISEDVSVAYDGTDDKVLHKDESEAEEENDLEVEVVVEENSSYDDDDDKSKSCDESNFNLNYQQIQVVDWMVTRESQKPHGGIIATDIGTADDKISIIMELLLKSEVCDLYDTQSEGDTDLNETISVEGHTLILCTKSSIDHWIDCIGKKIPSGLLNVWVHYGRKKDISLQNLSQKDIVITTVTLVLTSFRLKENNVLYQIKWNRIILDDPLCKHYNYKLRTSQALCNLSGICHWIFAGPTFIDNDYDEEVLYGLIKFINYEPLNNFENWKKWLKANKSVSIHGKLMHLYYN